MHILVLDQVYSITSTWDGGPPLLGSLAGLEGVVHGHVNSITSTEIGVGFHPFFLPH